MRTLGRAELSENSKRRLLQSITDSTKRNRYRECLVVGNHRGKVVKGHIVPKSWLKKLSDDKDEVYVFASHPVRMLGESPDRELSIADKLHINNALVRSFTCEGHEPLFSSVDQTDPDLSNFNNLNRMLYRAISGQLWLEILIHNAFTKAFESSPQDELFQVIALMCRENRAGLRYYKKEAERCLDPEVCRRCRGGPCRTIAHRVIRLPGEGLLLSASQFTAGHRTVVRIPHNYHSEPQVQPIANWGITVLPMSKGHKVVLHYFREEERFVRPEFDYIQSLQGRKQEAQISALLLSSCENIAISPHMWEQIGERRQQAILKMFQEERKDVGFGTEEMLAKWERDRMFPSRRIHVPHPNLVNMFRTTIK